MIVILSRLKKNRLYHIHVSKIPHIVSISMLCRLYWENKSLTLQITIGAFIPPGDLERKNFQIGIYFIYEYYSTSK